MDANSYGGSCSGATVGHRLRDEAAFPIGIDHETFSLLNGGRAQYLAIPEGRQGDFGGRKIVLLQDTEKAPKKPFDKIYIFRVI